LQGNRNFNVPVLCTSYILYAIFLQRLSVLCTLTFVETHFYPGLRFGVINLYIMIPTLSDIQSAHERIKDYIHHTPILTSQAINSITGAEISFKCENFQKVGAFKFRGACNAVFSLPDSVIKNGVATHSSGNHAAALALAAKIRGVKAFIVMPENAPEVKKRAVAGYGAEITFCEPTLQARESTLEQVVEKTSATTVHPYNNFEVICGQGTAALEILDDVPAPDIVMTPVGGGGLLSGTAIAVKGVSPSTVVYAAEPFKASVLKGVFNSQRVYETPRQ